jgi:hypothetical protein
LFAGGTSVWQLARAGRIEGDRMSLQRTDQMFRTGVDPWCSTEF